MRALQGKGVSAARACSLVGYTRSNLYYRRKPKDEAVTKARLQELATERPRWGWRRLLILLRGEHVTIGEHRFRRLYGERGLHVRARYVRDVRGKRDRAGQRGERALVRGFMHDTLASGRTIRTPMVIDDFTRECLGFEVERGFGSSRVIAAFEAIAFERGLARTLRFDNGAGLTSHAMLRWGAENAIELHFIDPGKPTQNAHVESFNGKARDEFLNLHSFLTVDQARAAAAAWRIDYNEVRPHSALGNLTPTEFANTLTNQASQLSAA